MWLNFCCHQRKLQRMSHFDILITKTVRVNMVNEQVTSISHQLLELSPLVSTSICHFFCLSVWSSAHRAPYLRNCTPCDHNFWYTYVKWWYHPVFCSFRFCFFRLLGRGVGGKTAKEGPKWKKKLYLSHAISQEQYNIWSWFLVHLCKMTIWPNKKNCLLTSERPGESFFPTMRPVNFFRNNKWIKKILNRKRKLKKEKWDQLKKKNAWSLFFFSCLYFHF